MLKIVDPCCNLNLFTCNCLLFCSSAPVIESAIPAPALAPMNDPNIPPRVPPIIVPAPGTIKVPISAPNLAPAAPPAIAPPEVANAPVVAWKLV